MDQKKETEYIIAVQQGDHLAYTAIVEHYKGPIFNLAYRMTGNYEDSADLSQEAFVKAYQSIHSFDPARRLFPWLYTICLNLIKNHLKKKVPFVADVQYVSQNFSGGESPEKIVGRSQESEKINVFLQQISLDMREAIVLRFYQDMSFEDISEVLGISLSSAKMRVYRGLENLKKLMEPDKQEGKK